MVDDCRNLLIIQLTGKGWHFRGVLHTLDFLPLQPLEYCADMLRRVGSENDPISPEGRENTAYSLTIGLMAGGAFVAVNLQPSPLATNVLPCSKLRQRHSRILSLRLAACESCRFGRFRE